MLNQKLLLSAQQYSTENNNKKVSHEVNKQSTALRLKSNK